MKKHLIIPIAGMSSRYPNIKPKWMLTHPSGKTMLAESLLGIDIDFFDYVYITLLKKHVDAYEPINGLISSLEGIINKDKLKITILDTSTNSQPETVYLTIKKNNINGLIGIKDCDNSFKIDLVNQNGVAIHSLDLMETINPSNKSYVLLNLDGDIINISEKNIISNLFSCGYYSFKDSNNFLKYYEKLKDNKNLYISHIIINMLMDGYKFIPFDSKNYIDWGTIEDWNNYVKDFKTLFIDIDGILVENSSQYFNPTWGNTIVIKENVDYLNQLYSKGKTQIILTTARKEDYKEITEEQLKKMGVKYDYIVYNLYHAKRIIINDFSDTNPYKSCDSININRNSKDLKKYL